VGYIQYVVYNISIYITYSKATFISISSFVDVRPHVYRNFELWTVVAAIVIRK